MLTKKQKDILDYINKYINKNDYAPTLREIMRHFKLKSVATVHQHIKTLKEKGYLKKEEKHPRAIKIKNNNLNSIKVPIIGTISAGQPIEAVENYVGTLSVPKDFIKSANDLYALKVSGNSMIDEGIFDGDTVIFKKQSTADDGQMVVAVIDDNEATLKKIYKEKNGFRLQPANQKMLPFFRKEVEIRGVVVRIIRNLENEKESILKDKKNVQDAVKVSVDSKSIFLNNRFKLNDVYNIDCFELFDNIKDKSVDLIFADPPYNLSKSNFKMKFVKSGGKDLNTNKGEWDNFKKYDDFEDFTKRWIEESYRVLKDGGAIWIAGTYHNIYLTGYLMQKTGFEILNEILWHKTDATPNLSCTRFVADHENFIWARKKGNKSLFNYSLMKELNGGKQMRSIWPKGKTTGGKKIHPTQKPEWLLERIILATSQKKDIILDPFMGSGTTAFVSKKLDRKFIGSELDKDFYKLTKNRLK